MIRYGFLAFIVAVAVTSWTAPASAQDSKPASLDELLDKVQQGWRAESAELQQREAEFVRRQEEQARLLEEARAALTAEEERGTSLERAFEENEARIAEMEQLLQSRMGTLGELFGHVRQVAGDLRGQFETSLTSAQLPGREAFLEELAQDRQLPEIEKLEHLWFLLQQEMTESGKVVRFSAPVILPEGERRQLEVIRVGSFNAVAGGKYLQWLPDVKMLAEIARQPASRYTSVVERFTKAAPNGLEAFPLDPSRGAILSMLVQTPNRQERVEQGGVIGYITIALGVLGGLIALVRLAYLGLVGRKVRAQRDSDAVRTDNPLGRVLAVYQQNRSADVETLELKLDEVILKESGGLDRYLWGVKVISVVAPLLGLLGTITGMIKTFQSIVLFGTGDPKLMAGGISEALVTTMIGLCVAIPLVLLHSIVSSMSRNVVHILEEQSVGLVASRAEADRVKEQAGVAAA